MVVVVEEVAGVVVVFWRIVVEYSIKKIFTNHTCNTCIHSGTINTYISLNYEYSILPKPS